MLVLYLGMRVGLGYYNKLMKFGGEFDKALNVNRNYKFMKINKASTTKAPLNVATTLSLSLYIYIYIYIYTGESYKKQWIWFEKEGWIFV